MKVARVKVRLKGSSNVISIVPTPPGSSEVLKVARGIVECGDMNAGYYIIAWDEGGFWRAGFKSDMSTAATAAFLKEAITSDLTVPGGVMNNFLVD